MIKDKIKNLYLNYGIQIPIMETIDDIKKINNNYLYPKSKINSETSNINSKDHSNSNIKNKSKEITTLKESILKKEISDNKINKYIEVKNLSNQIKVKDSSLFECNNHLNEIESFADGMINHFDKEKAKYKKKIKS